jgi:Rrf2 family transcriptional regulator, nitric oxide-sensitive transcriptional repressor
MQKVNRKIEYSLMALKHMSGKTPGILTTAKEVSEAYRAPFDATARVMQAMAQRGWLKSEFGASGGYQITRDLSKLTLLDLMDTIQGPTAIAKCIYRDKVEPCEIQDKCNIVSPIHSLNTKLTDFYKSISIRELLSQVQKVHN